MFYEILWILLSIPSTSALAEFFEPGPPPYPRWTVGDTQEIRYKTTYTEYTIALWQQFDQEETTNGPGEDFDWLVQTFDFELDNSDKFFLWLKEGGSSAQKNDSAENQQTSGYFFISPESSTTTTSSSPSSTSSSPPSTSGDSSTETSEASSNDSNSAGGELSTGAKAGIGAGAGVGGLALLSAGLLFFRYRTKNKRKFEDTQSTTTGHWSYGGPPMDMTKPYLPPTPAAIAPSYELPAENQRERVELDGSERESRA